MQGGPGRAWMGLRTRLQVSLSTLHPPSCLLVAESTKCRCRWQARQHLSPQGALSKQRPRPGFPITQSWGTAEADFQHGLAWGPPPGKYQPEERWHRQMAVRRGCCVSWGQRPGGWAELLPPSGRQGQGEAVPTRASPCPWPSRCPVWRGPAWPALPPEHPRVPPLSRPQELPFGNRGFTSCP